MDEDKTDVEESTAKRIRTSSIITRPTFFMAVQVSNPVIHQAVSIIQNSITSKNPLYKSALIKLITLHITLCTLHLTRNADIRRAKTALQKLETEMKDMLLKQPITLKFKGIGTFKNEVVFAKVVDGEPLQRMMELHIHLIRALKDEGLIVKDKFDPHLTIMKMSKDWKLRKKKIYKIPKDLYEENSEMEFGDQPVRSVQLLRMGKRAEMNYYNCYHNFDFGSKINEFEDHEDCCGVKSVIPRMLVELGPEELDDKEEVLEKKRNSDLEAKEGDDNRCNELDKKLTLKEKRKRKRSLRRAKKRALLFRSNDFEPSEDERLELLRNIFQDENADVLEDQALEMLPSLFQGENMIDKVQENRADDASNDLIPLRYETSSSIVEDQDGNTIAGVIESQEKSINLEFVDGKGELEVPDENMTFEMVESQSVQSLEVKDEEIEVDNRKSLIKEKSNFEAMEVQEENINIVAMETQKTDSNVDISVAEK